ncbi:PIG-L family deacetylase [Dietzia kunjamensis]|uniref:PIG-L deacetylase family protein n=1 Tax=Dietzia kunjamensis TaxID=322509 RepID=UPI0022B54FC3|nr:PIG-L family deacetylase [Dietzia kunjamensis]MCZ4657613.1 PIG-L family deacetylase [Dietzia kunjamensis]
MSDSVLLVVAHPDDEALGAGATARTLADRGFDVTSCFLSGEVNARQHRPSDDELRADTENASRILGMRQPILGPFPNIKMNTVPHLEMVQFIETAVSNTGARWIFTHHPGDINDDHRQVSRATLAAARLFQRGSEVASLKGLFLMEIASSTDWAFYGAGEQFAPNAYFPVSDDALQAKIDALAAYRGVMRPYPHPRCEEVLRSHAVARGAESGLGLCEAFQSVHLDLGDVMKE